MTAHCQTTAVRVRNWPPPPRPQTGSSPHRRPLTARLCQPKSISVCATIQKDKLTEAAAAAAAADPIKPNIIFNVRGGRGSDSSEK